MDFKINYYKTLGVSNAATNKEIKKAYLALSNIHHPDKNDNGDATLFNLITESYTILTNIDNRLEYDKRSHYGALYDEAHELYGVDFEYDYAKEKSQFNDFIKNEVIDIHIKIDDTFDGTLEYERWVKCKECDGCGKDLTSKIVIRDVNGNITKVYEGEDGCDFCEGTGVSYLGLVCGMCGGHGKTGMMSCKKCNGEKRIYGKQKLTNIKIENQETKLECKGNYSKNVPDIIGHLYLIKKS